jgi:hypothetical protein
MMRPEPEDYGLYDGPHELNPATLFPGIPAACVCGWTPDNHPGFILADHLRDMEETRFDP